VLRAHCPAPVVTCSLQRREADYAGDPQPDGTLWVCERATGETATLPVPPPGGYMAENALAAVAVARRNAARNGPQMETALGRLPAGGHALGGGECARLDTRSTTATTPIRSACARRWTRLRSGRRRAGNSWRWGRCWNWGGWRKEEHEALGRQGGRSLGRRGGGARRPAGQDAAAHSLVDGLQPAGFPAITVCVARDSAEAAAWLRERLRPGDALLLKASRGIRIEPFWTI
jgi:hypothetical protein